MGEPHEAHDDVFVEPVGQRFEVGVCATVLERQYRDPEPFVRTTGSGWGHADRRLSRRKQGGVVLQLLTELVNVGSKVLHGLIAPGRILGQAPADHTLQCFGRGSADIAHLRCRRVDDLVQ